MGDTSFFAAELDAILQLRRLKTLMWTPKVLIVSLEFITEYAEANPKNINTNNAWYLCV